MKKISLLLLLLVAGVTFAQQATVNNYEYIIVPSKFNFCRTKDEFRLNTLTKLLLRKYGFKAYLDNEVLPEEVADSNCKRLYCDVESSGGLLKTRVRVIIKDCKNITLYATSEGENREKDWGKAYDLAIRQAFESFDRLNYKFTPMPPKTPETPGTTATGTTLTGLQAQPMANGYQLVDSTSKIVMKIFKTSSAERFTAVKGDVNGELINRNGIWYFDHFENEKLVSEKIEVKF